jgi:hypothetical protein
LTPSAQKIKITHCLREHYQGHIKEKPGQEKAKEDSKWSKKTSDAYDHMKDYGLPQYEWHLMKVATRTRFTAYSHELSATYGFMFIMLVLLWLRAHGVRDKVRIRLDNGLEFCAGSQKKLDEWNKSLSVFGVTLDPIPPGAKRLLALVENAHRSDDEYFLMIHAGRCFHTSGFLDKAQRWQDTWNFYRPHSGLGMKGMTPREKRKYTKTMVHWHVQLFPVLLLERVLKVIGTPNQLFKHLIGGKYVHTICPFLLPRAMIQDETYTI